MAKLTEVEEKEVVKLYSDGLAIGKISKKFSKGNDTIEKILEKNNVKLRRITKVTKKEVEEIVTLYKDGHSTEKLSLKFKRAHNTIEKILEENEVNLRKRTKITTTETTEIIKHYKEMWSINKISNHYKRSKEIIKDIFKKNNITIRKQRKISKKEGVDIINLYNTKKISCAELAKKFNFSTATICKFFKKNNIKVKNISELSAEKNKNKELKIVKLYQNGLSIKDIIKKFDIKSQTTVHNILRRHNICFKNILSKLEKENIVKYYNGDWSINKIAKHFKRSHKTITKILKGNNIEIREVKIIQKEDKPKIINLYTKGHDCNMIAKKFNFSRSSIHKFLVKSGMKTRDRKDSTKEKNKERDIEIINIYKEKCPIVEISDKFDISSNTMYAVLRKYDISLQRIPVSIEVIRQIIEIYSKEFKNSYTIAKELNMIPQTILGILKRNNIKIRDVAQSQKELNDEEYEEYIKTITEFQKYRNEVLKVTNRQDLNSLPNIEKRGNWEVPGAYHLDHMYTVFEGFENKVPTEIIGNINNLEMLPFKDNLTKYTNCSHTLEELYAKIEKANQTQLIIN